MAVGGSLKRNIVIVLLLVVLLGGGYSVVSALSMKGVPVFQAASAVETVDKVRKAEKQGGVLTLNEAEINALIKLYTEKKIASVSGVQVKDLDCRLGDNQVELFAQGTWQDKLGLVFYTQGSLAVVEGGVVYTPQDFKLGRLTLPKSWVLSQLQRLSPKGVKIDQGRIILAKELFPYEITALTVTPEQMTIGLKKVAANPTAGDPLNQQGTAEQESKPETSPTQGSSSSSTAPSEPKDQTENPVKDATQIEKETRKELLQQVHSELGTVYGVVKTAKEKEIVGTMMGTVSNLVQNPTASYQGQAQWVLSEYKKLSPAEKNDLKMAMLGHMDISTAIEVKNLFGL